MSAAFDQMLTLIGFVLVAPYVMDLINMKRKSTKN
jgi:hypothetical protein